MSIESALLGKSHFLGRDGFLWWIGQVAPRDGQSDQVDEGQGWSNMRSILKNSEANCIGLCDVDKDVLDNRSNDVEKITGKKPKLYGDYRKMLENKDIDAVVIGTPDHWHCLNLVDSLEAGKHAYCEKPISNSITEANIMLESAKYHGKCVQVGQWQRSGGQYNEAIDYLWRGKLG